MATTTRKPAAKKTTAKKASKPAAPTIPTPKPKSLPGRTSPALVNRHRWSVNELANYVHAVDKAKKAGMPPAPIFASTADMIGNGIGVDSVKANYYAAKKKLGQTPTKPDDKIPTLASLKADLPTVMLFSASSKKKGRKATSQGAPKVTSGKRADVTALGDAPEYGTDPVKRVQAMVARRGKLAQAIQQAQAELAQIDSVLGAIV